MNIGNILAIILFYFMTIPISILIYNFNKILIFVYISLLYIILSLGCLLIEIYFPNMILKNILPVYDNHLQIILCNLSLTIFALPFVSYTTLYDPFLTFIIRLIGYLLIGDTAFYWLHRLSHKSLFLWKYHKMHHEFTYPGGVTAIYAHPVDFIISNLIPFLAGPFIMGYSLHTLVFWLTFVIFNIVISHSGIKFPIYYDPKHGIHHVKKNVNYSFLIWDKICGTELVAEKSFKDL